MGVEYHHFIVANPNIFRPEPEQIVSLVEALRREAWIPGVDLADDGGGFFFETPDGESHSPIDKNVGPVDLLPFLQEQRDSDLLLMWPVSTFRGLRYALQPLEQGLDIDADDRYCEFRMHLGKDLIVSNSGYFGCLADYSCVCGQILEYDLPEDVNDPFFSMRVHLKCPVCGTLVDSSRFAYHYQSTWTGEDLPVPGPSIYRFAIEIECGKDFPNSPMQISPELIKLVEKVLSCTAYEVFELY